LLPSLLITLCRKNEPYELGTGHSPKPVRQEGDRLLLFFYVSRCSNFTVYPQQLADERESDDDLADKLCKRTF